MYIRPDVMGPAVSQLGAVCGLSPQRRIQAGTPLTYKEPFTNKKVRNNEVERTKKLWTVMGRRDVVECSECSFDVHLHDWSVSTLGFPPSPASFFDVALPPFRQFL